MEVDWSRLPDSDLHPFTFPYNCSFKKEDYCSDPDIDARYDVISCFSVTKVFPLPPDPRNSGNWRGEGAVSLALGRIPPKPSNPWRASYGGHGVGGFVGDGG